MKTRTRTCLLAALLATALLASWQALTVRYTYGGNWTGLYCAGSRHKDPSSVLHENIYRLPDSAGYDGQFYHLIAHDPFLRRNFVSFMDDPRYRYGRILVPALAYLIAFGQDSLIDPAYLGILWLSIFAGTYWLSRYAVLRGYSAWLGILFAATPAVLVSVDRLTVDTALAACCVGFALYAAQGSDWKRYAVLAAAGLTRETGLLLVVAWCAWLAYQRCWRQVIIFATAGIPAACWFLFVRLHTPPVSSSYLSFVPFGGITQRVLHSFPHNSGGPVMMLSAILDVLALAGIVAAFAWAFGRACVRALSPVAIALYLFALVAVFVANPDAWAEVYGFGRTLTPFLLLAALDGLSVHTIVPALSILTLDPRIGLQMGGQILNVARGLLR
jgi:hypothetical protein